MRAGLVAALILVLLLAISGAYVILGVSHQGLSKSTSSSISQVSETATGVATVTNCQGSNALCGPYILLVNTELTSSATLGENESLLAGTIECTHSNLSPPSSIELSWTLPNPVNGGYPAGTNVTTIHIASTGTDWSPTWTLDPQGENATTYSFMIPSSELSVVRGMNYTIQAVADWSSGPLSHATPADVESVTVTAS